MATITRAEFLQEYESEYKSWASQAAEKDIQTPSDARIVQGWLIEQPKHSLFNWHMNRCDQRLAELEARVAWLELCLAAAIGKYEIKQP